MANQRAVFTTALLLIWARLCTSAQTYNIEATNPQIQYFTGKNTNTTNPSWGPVAASPTICPVAQQVTERVGDYAVFTFTGTQITLFGTIGVKRGIIEFSFDGQNTTFDRTKTVLECQHPIFLKANLPFQEHTLIATLSGKQPALDTGLDVGVLSIQRISFTIPDDAAPIASASKNSPSQPSTTDTNAQGVSPNKNPGSNLSTIIGASVGGSVVIAFAFALLFFFKRRRNARARTNHDAFPDMGSAARQKQYPKSMGEQGQDWIQTSEYIPDPPDSTTAAQTSLLESPSLVSTSIPRLDKRQESLTTNRDSTGVYFASNPDSRSGSVYSGPTFSYADDYLADRVATRLADIMQGRGVTTPLHVPPPVYEPKREDTKTPMLQDHHLHSSSGYPDLAASPANITNNTEDAAALLESGQQSLSSQPARTRPQQGPMYSLGQSYTQSPLSSVAEVSTPEQDIRHTQPETYPQDSNRTIYATSLSDQATPQSNFRRLPPIPTQHPSGP